MMDRPLITMQHAEQVVCANCRHSKELDATSKTLGCMQTVDPVSGGTVNYAATWRLKGMPESIASEVAEELEVCGPQGRFFSARPVEMKKKRWWLLEFNGD